MKEDWESLSVKGQSSDRKHCGPLYLSHDVRVKSRETSIQNVTRL